MMNRTFVFGFSSLVVVLALVACAADGGRGAGGGWVTLLDGSNPKTLDNWTRSGGEANWRVVDGAVQADKGAEKATSHLVSKEAYKDFQLRAEFWADHTTNSGIFIRIQDPKSISSKNSYEVNIYDQRPGPEYGTGAIVNFGKVDPMPKAGGKWNTFLITAKGTNLIVELNGKQTVNINDSSFASGPFSLQFGNRDKGAPGGAIKWRKVEIRPL
jgi:hypothetical protein